MKSKLVFILLILVFLSTTGLGCKQGNLAAYKELSEPITLKYWRVFDGDDTFSDIIASYRQTHPNINIEYKKLRYEEYEQALLEAWAEDRGPDMLTIHNTWVKKYQDRLTPMPESIRLPYVSEADSRTGKMTKADYKQTKAFTPMDVKNKFADVVYQDVVKEDKIFGLPLSVDSLALFYNRTLFDNAQITKPPATWIEVKEAVKKLTIKDETGKIVQAGIALGTSNNINRAGDVLSLLMMQNGAEMVDVSGGRALFHEESSYASKNSSGESFRPGVEALNFYTSFASPIKDVYTWNDELPEAAEAFVAGKAAMMLGYAYQLPLIRTQGSRLNIGVIEVPHINLNGTDSLGSKINIASYWVETVAKKTQYENYAWDFLMFATSAEQAEKYLNKTKKPTALRSLVDKQANDYEIAPFANQVLTAKSWYRGRDPQAAEQIFKDMINNVVSGKTEPQEAANFAANKINQTF
ncbi:MAG TPA: extracellular solute-binding protein [Patescibacteria group bacterium]|nr:extracellular solute-binding protein [Patescibacteria group bacterium]